MKSDAQASRAERTLSTEEAAGLISRLRDNITSVIHGQDEAIRKLLAALLSGGHVLLEDVPGTGKTTLAKTLARSIRGSDFKRLQFTPDLLPSDVLGVSILDPRDNTFVFHPGPIFTNVLLVDEINRASPRTQSALLEAMAEGQATIEGECRPLHPSFFVIATQNPIEFRGTYPLPEAQMDRFALQCSLGYVAPEDEVAILSAQAEYHPSDRMQAVISLDDIMDLRRASNRVRVSEEIKRYIVDLVGATRKTPQVQLAASPRASLALVKATQAMALSEGMDFVLPRHVAELAGDVIAHRLVLDSQASYGGQSNRDVVASLLESIPMPS